MIGDLRGGLVGPGAVSLDLLGQALDGHHQAGQLRDPGGAAAAAEQQPGKLDPLRRGHGPLPFYSSEQLPSISAMVLAALALARARSTPVLSSSTGALPSGTLDPRYTLAWPGT